MNRIIVYIILKLPELSILTYKVEMTLSSLGCYKILNIKTHSTWVLNNHLVSPLLAYHKCFLEQKHVFSRQFF